MSLSLREHILKTTCPNFTEFPMNFAYSRGSVIFWRCCDMLLCTDISSSVDDVMLAYNRPGEGDEK